MNRFAAVLRCMAIQNALTYTCETWPAPRPKRKDRSHPQKLQPELMYTT